MAYYYGKLHVWPNGKNGQVMVCGEIGQGNANISALFYPSGKAFCPWIPDDLRDQNDLLVSFDSKPNADPAPGKDAQLVMPESMRPFGWRVVRMPQEIWDHIPPELDGAILADPVPTTQGIVLETSWDDRSLYVGPWWHVGGVWRPKDNHLGVWDAPDGLPTVSLDGVSFVINPPPTRRKLDASDAQQLLGWWRKSLIKLPLYKQIIDRFDRENQGWTSDLKNYITTFDPEERERERHRFEKTIRLFDTLDWQAEEWNRVLASDAGQAALRTCIRQRADELERAVKPEWDARMNAAQQRLNVLEAECATKSAMAEAADRRIDALREVVEHLATERSRLAKDIVFWRDILDGVSEGADTVESGQATEDEVPPPGAVVSYENRETFVPLPLDAPLELTVDAFVTERLLARLRMFDYASRRIDAQALHAALSVCRAVRVPHPGWTRAYAEAMGHSAYVRPMVAAAHWRSFGDAWRDGLAEAWRAAQAYPDYLCLVHVKELALAFPDAWMHPLLDLLTGHVSCLPTEGHPAWPDNLRLCWSDTGDADRDRFPLPATITAHFPVIRATGKLCPEPPGGQPDGYIPIANWRQWRTTTSSSWEAAAEAVLSTNTSLPAGALALAICDVAGMTAVLDVLDNDGEYTAEDHRRRAVALRIPCSEEANGTPAPHATIL